MKGKGGWSKGEPAPTRVRVRVRLGSVLSLVRHTYNRNGTERGICVGGSEGRRFTLGAKRAPSSC
jgi:hypothetical protein